MTPVMFLAVAAGGACGALLRYALSLLIGAGFFGIAGPMATLSVNIGGSAMMGLLADGMAAGSLLQRTGQMMSLVYICLSVGLSLLAFGAAHMLAGMLTGMLFGRGGG